ncbi:MAG TPA: hypothetical protein VHR45_09145 [Thermoanaerobaculia bacterium]|nr:hypothetical protein [Thermoanaerobaculia bacterium]
MSVNLQVTIETKAEGRIAFVNFKEVPLSSTGTGGAIVELGQGCVLQWGIVGTPGTTYKITLKPETGKLKIEGQHPISLQVAQGHIRSAGTRRFSVVAGGA